MKKLCLIIFCLTLLLQTKNNKTVVEGSVISFNYPFRYNCSSDTIRGIDVSAHQKKIIWSKIDNVHFAFIKATEGVSIKDQHFRQNWDSSRRVGILRGAYHFYRPYVSPESQFENFKSVVDIRPGDLPPVLDAEIHSNNSKKLKNDFKKWLLLAEKHYGVTPIIYCSSGFYKKYFKDPYFDKYPFWIANYVVDDINSIHEYWFFWQHTCFGKVNGISTYVDKNLFNGTYDSLISLCKR